MNDRLYCISRRSRCWNQLRRIPGLPFGKMFAWRSKSVVGPYRWNSCLVDRFKIRTPKIGWCVYSARSIQNSRLGFWTQRVMNYPCGCFNRWFLQPECLTKTRYYKTQWHLWFIKIINLKQVPPASPPWRKYPIRKYNQIFCITVSIYCYVAKWVLLR